MKTGKEIVLNRTLRILTVFLFLGLIVFLLFASTKAGLNFDSSYNLLSYQSLFNGTGFVYEYDGKKIPFDPVISTGPELYLPAFFIWKLIGQTDYQVAVFVAVSYFIIFLAFFIFGVLENASQRCIALSAFLFWFFSNGKLFGISSNLLVDPLGEVFAICLVFAGFYFLNRKKTIISFLLLGLALDTKPNIIIALIPTVAILIFQKYLSLELKRKNYRTFFQTGIRIIPLSLLMFLPYLAYSKIAPSCTLNDHEKKVFYKARAERNVYMLDHGFGQAIDLYRDFTPNGIGNFLERTTYKMERLHSFFGKSYFGVALFGFLLVFILILSRGHWSFYLFLFSVFFISWWLFLSRNTWYRYFFTAEFNWILGMAVFLPSLIAKKNKFVLILLMILLAGFCLPRFSFHNIKHSVSGEEKENLMLMKEKIEPIDENQIFTLGWLQCPQVMFLTNKRFQDFLNKEKVEKAKKDGAYFLTTYENILMQKEMNTITKNFDLIVSYGYNKLYRIQ